MRQHPSPTQLAALKAMENDPLVRHAAGWQHPGSAIVFSVMTIESCSRNGWCKVTAFANRRSKASITQAGRDALRAATAEKEIAASAQ